MILDSRAGSKVQTRLKDVKKKNIFRIMRVILKKDLGFKGSYLHSRVRIKK
jgi:hypothetical protein